MFRSSSLFIHSTRTVKSIRYFNNTTKLFANSKVFFDIDIDGKDSGRVTFELYDGKSI